MAKSEKDRADRQKDPKVVFMGTEFNSERRLQHRHDGSSPIFGILLIFAGALLLLNTLGIVPWDIWNRLAYFWPLLIILGGLHIVLGHNIFSRIIVGSISVIVLGLIVLIALKETSPALLANLPPNLLSLLSQLEGALQR